MNFKKAIESKNFIITAEIAPPKGTDIDPALNEAASIQDLVDGINVTDNQRAVMRLSPIALCARLVEKKISPIMQMTCRDRNRIALQADLLSAAVLGIENVLILTGDSINAGDHIDAKEVFDLDSISLLETAAGLNKGIDMHNRPLSGKTDFMLGAAINPGAEPKELQVIQTAKKISAGARFFQTQLVFDIDDFKGFLSLANQLPLKTVKILAGIFPLKSAKQARFLNEKVAGVKIPEPIIKRLDKASNPIDEGLAIASDLIGDLKHLCNGVHIMAMNNKETLIKLLSSVQSMR
ncbi:MAG: methylenetetrahydrofolate reductase [Elusimicrobia bacterium]|nr:methylenetetrahydrofolate reductase [Elusimicrobiota bacterium]